MARHGQFSLLWADMAQKLGLEVEIVDLAWGAGVPANEFARILGNDRHGKIKAVFVTHNETATGVTSDVALVRRALDESRSTTRCCSWMACPPSGRSISAWMNGASTLP
jgi:alanine-glyoxylate transaminase / serine-glyoxylate transaminase / serine-pyruvate transaminase